jgi:hypothetical protein
MTPIIQKSDAQSASIDRRSFLKLTGVSAVVVSTIVSCDNSDSDSIVNIGGGDIGLLNYVYALEQLQAEFYTKLLADPAFTTTFSVDQQAILTDIHDHEIAHREFIKNSIGIDAIDVLDIGFKGITFSNKTQTMLVAQELEDMSVAAYNYIGKLFVDANLLIVITKIVSVEARHSAVIRDLQSPRSANFAGDDVVDESGFDKALSPQDIMTIANKYILSKVNVNNLPTS